MAKGNRKRKTMKEFVDNVIYWLNVEGITATIRERKGDDFFLDLVDNEGETHNVGSFADDDILLQPCEDCRGEEMVLFNNLPVAKLGKLVTGLVMGYPA